MEALQLFVAHEKVVLDASPSFFLTNQKQNDVQAPNAVTNFNSSLETTPNFKSDDTANSESQTDQESKIFLKTKYGIQVEMDKNANQVLNISLCSTNQAKDKSDTSSVSNKPILHPDDQPANSEHSDSESSHNQRPYGEIQHRYRLFPDCGTTYLWNDLPTDDFFIEFDIIEKRYPALFPFYMEWLDNHEAEYNKWYFSGGKNATIEGDSPFSDEYFDAWDINGFLLSCWLAFQSDVYYVKFQPAYTEYEIMPGTMELEFQKFLAHKTKELREKKLG